VHRHAPARSRFCRALAAELGHATQCNAYITPAASTRASTSTTTRHDVFVLQVSGPQALDRPRAGRAPAAVEPAAGRRPTCPEGAEPLLDVELEAGDCLYLPRGYVHAALTTDEHSVHLTVGVLSTTWFDVLTDALALAKDELAFRDALPVQPRGAVAASLPDLLHSAALFFTDLDPARLADVVDGRLARAVPPEPVRLLAGAAALQHLSATTPVRPRLGTGAVREGSAVRLPDRVVAFPDGCAPALARALQAPALVADLALGGLDEDDAVVLARRLLREGVLLPA
jgi:hypothetical protein